MKSSERHDASRGKNPDVKVVSRVRIEMPDGESVVVSGRGLNMARLTELLGQAQKEVRKAAPQHDVKSFASMQRVQAGEGGGSMNQKELSTTAAAAP